ncbi:MAG: hypothetical protein ACI861_001108 [Paracoccaceae bacterium]|jgi:hypothetical protein
MFSIFRIIGVFFNLGPRMTGFVSVTLAVIAVLLTLNSIKDGKVADELIAAGPPSAVNIDDFDADIHKTDLLEVHIIGQLDARHIYEYTKERKGGITRKTLIPILEVTNPLGRPLAMVELDATDGDFEAFKEMVFGAGSIGPIVQVNGVSVYSGSYASEAEKALMNDFGFYSPDMLYVRPFFGNRSEQLEGGTASLFFAQVLGVLAVLFGILAFVKYRRNKPAPNGSADTSKASVKGPDSPEQDSVVRRK